MGYPETILPEFDEEVAKTREVLAAIPDDKMDWRAHPDCNTIGWNANHIAEIPGWVEGTLASPSWDLAPPDGEGYQSPKLTTTREIVDLFDRNVASARKAIAAADDAAMDQEWSLLYGGKTVFTMPRRKVVRSFVLNHLIHHRAILSIYLRMNSLPVPSLYNPSAH